MEYADRTNVLFVCSRNLWRSPTAGRVFSCRPDLSVRSAGTALSARRRVSEGGIVWADTIFVMEHKHAVQLRSRFRSVLSGVPVHVLGIADEYKFMDAELVRLLECVVTPLLPAAADH